MKAYGLPHALQIVTLGAVLRAPDSGRACPLRSVPRPPPPCSPPPSARIRLQLAVDFRATGDADTTLRRARPAPRVYGLHIGSSPPSFIWSCPRCRSLSSPLRGSSVSRPALSYVHALHQWRCYALPVASYVRVLPPSGVGRSPTRQRGRFGSSPIPRTPLPLRVRVVRSPR